MKNNDNMKNNNKKEEKHNKDKPIVMTRPCIMVLRDMQWEDHHDDHERECELDPADNNGVSGKIVELNVNYDIDARDEVTGAFESGVTTLEAMDATIQDEKAIIRGNPTFKKKQLKKHESRRLATEGTKSVLVVRVKAADAETTSSEEVLAREIFGIKDSSGESDSFNLVSGFSRCSNDKLKFEPTKDSRATNGVYTVTIPNTVSGEKHRIIREAATQKVADELGDLGSQFDHVMICLPPGTGNWIAYAYINNWRSVYNDEWCTKPSAQMHEIGHNLGLGHSTENDQKYGDQTGMMGYSYFQDEGPAMCFNNAKNWQLGFYQDKHTTVKPLDDSSWTGKLVGFVDYGTSTGSNDETVVLKVEGHNKNYYVGFNHKEGINGGNAEPGAGNRVTIQSRDTKDGFGESALEAVLSVGESLEIPEFGGRSRSALVQVININLGASPATAEVSVELLKCLSNDDCNDNSSCTDDVCNTSTGTCFNVPNDTCSGVLKMTLLTDNYPSDISWNIVDNCNANKVVMSGGDYTDKTETFDHEVNMPPSEYTLTINDSYGDGICCGSGEGSYTVAYNNEVVATGGDYGKGEIKTWGSCEDAPAVMKPPAVVVSTDAPTPSPTASPTASPTSCEVFYELTINTDENGGDTSWDIVYDMDRSTTAASSNKVYESESKYVESGCLDTNCYRFTIKDSWNDGMCCSHGEGSYSLKINGSELASGGEFKDDETTLFGTCKSWQFQTEMSAEAAIAKKNQKD